MKLISTPIAGAWLIDIEPIRDDRGFFARSYCADIFSEFGFSGCMVQQSISFNARKGTLRGMHYQESPYGEIKLVRVTQGNIYDVILDLRHTSPSYMRWYGVELSANNHRSLFIPRGVAHGFQTLEDFSEVFYQMDRPYVPDHSRGVLWCDPLFAIEWPLLNPILSERDTCYPLYEG